MSSIAAAMASRSWVSAGPPGRPGASGTWIARGAGDPGQQRVHLERAPGEGDARARVVEGLRELLADRDRAAAGDHLRGVHAVAVGQRPGQDDGAVVGVAVGVGRRGGQRLDDGRQRREGDLVAGELDRAVDADLAGEVGGVAARLVGGQRLDGGSSAHHDVSDLRPRVTPCAYSSPVEPATSAA